MRNYRTELYDAVRSADDAYVEFKLPRSAFKNDFEWRMALIDIKSRLSTARYEERMRAIEETRRG